MPQIVNKGSCRLLGNFSIIIGENIWEDPKFYLYFPSGVLFCGFTEFLDLKEGCGQSNSFLDGWNLGNDHYP